ncbi:MAG TPA: hypothetical protein PLR88_08345 [Bacteroidales bacterium]|jgi:hypothetical protein|nr:hypothetical protein [Bacteroidales bacterium]
MEQPVTIDDINEVIDETLKYREAIMFAIREIGNIENKIILQGFVVQDKDLKDYQYLYSYMTDFCKEMYDFPSIDFFRSTVDLLSEKLASYKYIIDYCNKKQIVVKSVYQWLYFKMRWIVFWLKFGPFLKHK